MLITLLSDIHGNIDKIEKISDELKTSDLVILSGDITHFGREADAKQVISRIGKYQSNILAVTGKLRLSRGRTLFIQRRNQYSFKKRYL